jgi:hypothetical protein
MLYPSGYAPLISKIKFVQVVEAFIGAVHPHLAGFEPGPEKDYQFVRFDCRGTNLCYQRTIRGTRLDRSRRVMKPQMSMLTSMYKHQDPGVRVEKAVVNFVLG